MRPGSSSRVALLFSLVAAACSAEGSSDTESDTDALIEPDAEVDWATLECDPLVPSHCGFPFPNNVFTESADTPTGRRLALSDAMLPVHKEGVVTDASLWARGDGFSASSYIMTHMPGATSTGLASPEDIGASIEASSPTILLDAETGELVAHFAELDLSTSNKARRSLLIHPAQRLEDGRRYIVAISGVVDEAGDALEATPAFAALRDLTEYDGEEDIDARRPLYADIFARLEDAGVAREELQLAWDFTTASTQDVTGDMVHMRDEALATGDIAYSIESVETDYETQHIAYRIFGRMSVPQYIENPDWAPAEGVRSSVLHRGDDDLPEPVGTYDVEFELLIPNSATPMNPATLLQYGHGLFGQKEEIENSFHLSFMNEYNYAFFSVDWKGMANEDTGPAAFVLSDGRLEGFESMMGRMHQGMLNALLAMRMMKDSFSQDPMYGGLIDPDVRRYHGISNGGILGGVYMALSTDVERGALGVPGQPYTLLAPRSSQFDLFFSIARTSFSDPRDIQLMLAMVQLLWNRIEPGGYTSHLRDDELLPGVNPKDVLVRAAVGDHQVNTLGAHHMARTIGLPHVDTGIRPVWGLEALPGPSDGGGYVEYGFGLPEDPWCNLPQSQCEDPHGKLRQLEESRVQLDHFLRTGEVEDMCSGPCVFEAMSGCSTEPVDVCGG